MSEIHVQIDQLSLSIEGIPLLDIPFLRLDPQGPTMILGPNGAGKSLFLRVLHALQTPDTGSVQVRHISGETARQAMVFQRPVLLRRSVRANLRFALSAAGYARQTRFFIRFRPRYPKFYTLAKTLVSKDFETSQKIMLPPLALSPARSPLTKSRRLSGAPGPDHA